MPTFRITDPQSGKTVSVTGDTPPSESDINQIMGSLPASQQQQSGQQQAQHPIMNFLRKVGLGAIPDIIGTGQFALNEANQGINPFNSSGATPDQLNKAAQGNVALSPQQLQQTGGVKQAAQDLAGAASYAVPFGQGANIASKVILPGAISGALQGASQDNGNIAQTAVEGAAGAGVMHGVGQVAAPLLSQLGQPLENLSNKILSSQYMNTPNEKIANRINEVIPQLAKYGITDPEQVPQIASVVTGPDGIVNNIKKAAIAKADNVDTGGIFDLAKNAIGQDAVLANTPTANNFLNIVKSGVYNSVNGDDAAGGDPTKIFQFIQQLEGQAAQHGRFPTSADQGLKTAYRTVANELKDRLFNGTDASGNVTRQGANNMVLDQALTPDQYNQLHSIHPQLASDVAGAKTVRDLRAIEAPFVKASNLANTTLERQSIKPMTPTDMLTFLLGGGIHPATVGAYAGKKYLESNMGKRQVGNALGTLGRGLQGSSAVGANPQNVLDLLGAKGVSSTAQ